MPRAMLHLELITMRRSKQGSRNDSAVLICMQTVVFVMYIGSVTPALVCVVVTCGLFYSARTYLIVYSPWFSHPGFCLYLEM